MPLLRSSQPKNKRPYRRRKRVLAVSGGALVCVATPIAWVNFSLYRANLAMANVPLPAAPALLPTDRVLVISPHPDDETLGAGGLLASARRMNLPVKLVFITNGDGSQSTRLYENMRQLRRYPNRPETFIKLAGMRQKEALKAVDKLGIAARDVVFLGYPDGGTAQMWRNHFTPDKPYRSYYTQKDKSPYQNARTPDAPYCGTSALEDVRGVMAEFKPTLVLSTHPADTHPDHRTAYDLSAAALEELRSAQDSSSWAKSTRLLGFLVHHGPWPVPNGYNPEASLAPPAALKNTDSEWLTVPLHRGDREAKRAALECYVSQLATTPRYLRSFVRRNELFGEVNTVQIGSSAQPVTLNKDAVQDALWQDMMPSGDIQGLTLKPETNGSSALQVNLVAPASKRLRYEVTLHELTSTAQKSPTVWHLRMHAPNGKWIAGAQSSDGRRRTLGVKVEKNSVQVQLPETRKPGQVLMVNASSRLRSNLLDQTDTAIARWE